MSMVRPGVLVWQWHVRTGYREYMRTPQVRQWLEDAGNAIAEEAGGTDAGFEVEVTPESGRRKVPRVSVRTATDAARRDEARNRTLTKSLDAGRNV